MLINPVQLVHDDFVTFEWLNIVHGKILIPIAGTNHLALLLSFSKLKRFVAVALSGIFEFHAPRIGHPWNPLQRLDARVALIGQLGETTELLRTHPSRISSQIFPPIS
jgi:hypothetical protein